MTKIVSQYAKSSVFLFVCLLFFFAFFFCFFFLGGGGGVNNFNFPFFSD